MSKRDKWIDVVKGIGILLVIMGHMPSLPIDFRNWIFSFHMPLFFVLSGYLFNMERSIKQQIGRFAKNYLIPYLIYSIVFILLDFILLQKDMTYVQSRIKSTVIGQGGFDILWFFTSVFIADVMGWTVCKLSQNEENGFLIKIAIPLITALISYIPCVNTYYKIAPGLYAIGFTIIGYELKQINIREKINKCLFSISGAVSITITAMLLFCEKEILDLNNNIKLDVILTYILAIAGTIFIMCIGKLIIKIMLCEKILGFIGANTVVFFPLTAYIPSFLQNLFEKNDIVVNGNWKILFKIISFGCCYLIVIIKGGQHNKLLRNEE